MADDFFRIYRGLELDQSSQFLTGSGNPAVSTDTQNAPVGSYYTDTATGNLWLKITSGTTLSDWAQMATQSYVDSQAATGISWREPAVARDNVSAVVPIGTAGNPIVVDGVTVTNLQRVLFSSATPQPANVYIYNQSTGLFTEDSNTLSTGDALYIDGGTSAGQTYVYNGTMWVLINQTSSDEIGFIDTFIGKIAGNTTPTYSSTNFVVNADSLQTAIGKLDAEFGTNVSSGNYILSTNKVNDNIQALDSKLGGAVTSTNFIVDANSVTANLSALDAEFGANVINGNYILAANKVNSNLTAIDTALGANVADGNFILAASKINQNIAAIDAEIGPNVTDGAYVLASNKINANIQAIDTALGDVSLTSAQTNVTTIATIDTIGANMVEWDVYVSQVSTPANVYATKVVAIQNGTGVDSTKYATLLLGAQITGVSVTVDFSSGNIRLRVASTSAVNVTARRITSL